MSLYEEKQVDKLARQVYIMYGIGLSREDTISDCWVSYLEQKDSYYSLSDLNFWTQIARHMIDRVKDIRRDRNRRYRRESKVSLNQTYMGSKEEIGSIVFPKQGDFTKLFDFWDFAMRLGDEKYWIIRGLVNGEDDEHIIKKLNLSDMRYYDIKADLQKDMLYYMNL